MAKKKAARKINRSQAIRDYMAQHSGASVNEIMEGLAAQGIVVSRGLVSNVKYTAGPKRKKRGRKKKQGIRRKKKVGVTKRRRRRPGPRATASISASDLIAAKKLVSELGDIAQARKALELLERLQ